MTRNNTTQLFTVGFFIEGALFHLGEAKKLHWRSQANRRSFDDIFLLPGVIRFAKQVRRET